MNSKISLFFNLILALLVGVLFYFQFKKTDSGKDPVRIVSNDSTATNASAPSGKIGYVNSDSLFKKYKFAVQLEADLQAKGKQMQNDLEGRGRALENEYKNLQEKVAVMTADEARGAEERIMKKKESIMMDEQKLTNQLAEFNQNVNRQLADTIEAFIKDFNQNEGFDFIFNHSSGAPILLYKNEALDVTTQVIDGLNKRWDDRKK
jgi:outer membrane protein